MRIYSFKKKNMKNLRVAELRQDVVLKIMHKFPFQDIEAALDAYVDEVISNTEKGIDLSVLTENQLSVMKDYYQSIIEVID